MKLLIIWLIGVIALWVFIYPHTAKSEAMEVHVAPEMPLQPPLSPAQEEWLHSLILCESGGNPKAINPKDLDQTASYGLLQFKPSTYALFSKRYKLASTTDFMNPVQQEQIVRNMILDEKVTAWEWRYRQFPSCVKKLGQHP